MAGASMPSALGAPATLFGDAAVFGDATLFGVPVAFGDAAAPGVGAGALRAPTSEAGGAEAEHAERMKRAEAAARPR